MGPPRDPKREKAGEKEPRSWSDPCPACSGTETPPDFHFLLAWTVPGAARLGLEQSRDFHWSLGGQSWALQEGGVHGARGWHGAHRGQTQQMQSTAVAAEEPEGAVGCPSPVSPGGQWGHPRAQRDVLSPWHSSQGWFELCPAPPCPPEHTDPGAELCHCVQSWCHRVPPLQHSNSRIPAWPEPGLSPPCSSLMQQIWGLTLTVRGLLVGFHPQHSAHQPGAFPHTVQGPWHTQTPLGVLMSQRGWQWL